MWEGKKKCDGKKRCLHLKNIKQRLIISMQYLRTKMILWILIFLFPIFIILCISMNGILSSYSKQMEAQYSQILRRFTTDIDSSLNAAKRILYSEKSLSDFSDIQSENDWIRLNEMQNLGAYLTDKLTTQEQINALFLYDGTEILFVQNYNTSYEENKDVSEGIKAALKQNPEQTAREYQAIKIEEQYYFHLGVKIEKQIFGCWFCTERLLQTIRSANQQGILDVFFSLSDGTALSMTYNAMNETEIRKQFPSSTLIRQKLSSAPFYLTVLWDNDVIYKALYRTQTLIICVMIFSFLLLMLYLIFLRSSLFIPLRQLTDNIDRLGTEPPVPLQRSKKESIEFQNVYHELIAMTGEIRDLKINVYEKELQQQKTQLDLYQLQIRPHFFMNVLNNIQCLVRSGKQKETDEMITMLICYCRYVLYSSQFVLLDEELNFIQNYVNLQHIQHHQEYELDIHCSEELLDYEIPTLIIQILVENVIKHGGGNKAPLKIEIRICEEMVKDVLCLKISVMDNGIGFSEEILKKLQADDFLHQPKSGHGIGIDNIRRRLSLLYGENANLYFENRSEGGSKAELLFPVEHIC